METTEEKGYQQLEVGQQLVAFYNNRMHTSYPVFTVERVTRYAAYARAIGIDWELLLMRKPGTYSVGAAPRYVPPQPHGWHYQLVTPALQITVALTKQRLHIDKLWQTISSRTHLLAAADLAELQHTLEQWQVRLPTETAPLF